MSKFLLVFFLLLVNNLQAQEKTSTDSSVNVTRDSVPGKHYLLKNGDELFYPKPKNFGFIKDLPKDAAGIVHDAFSKKAVKPWLMIAGSTALLMLVDKPVIKGVENLARNIHLHPEEGYNNVLNVTIGGKETNLLKIPKNLNTAFYEIGQGFPTMLIAAGLYVHGKFSKNYRSLSTASQLAETFILMGVGTQILKRITGRQSPSEPERPEGQWRPFPSFSEFQNHTPNYDAFPSGHLATLVSSITVLAENYPEKRWIKPVGYSISGLVCFAMMNNKVHWISDYPLAIGMGYVCAKNVVKHHRKLIQKKTAKATGSMSYSVSYQNGSLQPVAVYHFK